MLIFGFFASLFLCQFLALKTIGTLNFYFTFSRAWELILGAICAYIIIYKNFSYSALIKNLLSTIGIILIMFSIFFFSRQTVFPSFHTLVPTIARSSADATLMIYVCIRWLNVCQTIECNGVLCLVLYSSVISNVIYRIYDVGLRYRYAWNKPNLLLVLLFRTRTYAVMLSALCLHMLWCK